LKRVDRCRAVDNPFGLEKLFKNEVFPAPHCSPRFCVRIDPGSRTQSFAQPITVNIQAPLNNGTSARPLLVSVTVQSVYQVQTVTAQVESLLQFAARLFLPSQFVGEWTALRYCRRYGFCRSEPVRNVSMTESLALEPKSVGVTAGDAVTWTNTSSTAAHTATADERRDRMAGFNSGSFPRRWLNPGEKFEFTFTTAGTYPYHCIPHEGVGMTGTVIVTDPPAGAAKDVFVAAPLADDEQILVRWSVSRYGKRVGFNVLRSTAWNEPFVKINDVVIEPEAVTKDRDVYRFVDQNVNLEMRYFYVIQEVRTDGVESYRGPAIANPTRR